MRAHYSEELATGGVTGPGLVIGDALREQGDIFARRGTLFGGDDEQTDGSLEETAAGERQVRAAQRVLADFGDGECDLADLEAIAFEEDDVAADEKGVLELAPRAGFAAAFCLGADAALGVLVVFGARDRRVARVGGELIGDA